MEKAKKRRVSMKSTEEFWSKRQHTDSSAMESWILSRQNDLVMGKVFLHLYSLKMKYAIDITS